MRSFRGAMFVIMIVFMITMLPRLFFNDWVQWAVVLPGTLGHEILHWAFALILNGHPTFPSVIPTFNANGSMDTLGSVSFIPTWYNAAPTALAPLLLAGVSFICLLKAVRSNIFAGILWCWISSTCVLSMLPSRQDWSIAFAYPTSFIVLIPISIVLFIGCRKVFRIILFQEPKRRVI